MLNLSDKRQHFRFPAYDDEVGVKLINNKKREFLKDILDDGFVYKKQDSISSAKKQIKKNDLKMTSIDPIDMVDAPDYFGYDNNSNGEDNQIITKGNTASFQQKKVVIEQNKKTIGENSTYVEPKNTNYTSPQSSFSNKLFETDNYGKAKYNKVDRSRSKFESSYDLPGYKGKNIFKPKHIPASLIEDSRDDEKPRHSREEIVNELRKASQGSLLMLEDEIVLDPIVDTIGLPIIEDTLEIPEKKKNQRLEKTLSGIISDEGSPKLDSYYFD